MDEVSYEGLVPGKEYTLKAELISKEDGKSVLGTGEKTFTPKKSEGMVPVTITVNDDVTEPVEAAVAFEELTSTEVNDKGEETPGTTPENPNHIAEHKDINDDNQTVTSHEVHDQDAPKGGNSDNGNGRGVEGQGQKPEEIGNALPSNAERVEIKSVPSGATKLEPGMQDYIK